MNPHSCHSPRARVRIPRRVALGLLGLYPAAFAEDPVVKIMPLGDSITRGNNDINHPNGDIPGGYRRKLGELLAAGGHAIDFVGSRADNAASGMDPEHEGHPGFRTDELLSNLHPWLAATPDTVLLMAGTNDILQNVPVATAATNLANLIEEITGTDPGRGLYVATIPPITMDWPRTPPSVSAAVLNANADLFNTQVRQLVLHYSAMGRRVSLADMSARITLDDPDPSLDFYQPGDGIHPGQAGYDQLGGLWFDTITAGGPHAAAAPAGLPARPSGLTPTVVSPSRVNLTWTDHATDETAYKVRRRNTASGSPWQEVATLPAGSSAHAVTGLETGTHHYAFTVTAVNARGESAWSEVVFSNAPGDHAHFKPASASSEFNSTFAASKANDGKHDTLWASGSGSAHYWQVDLGNARHIQRVELVTRQDNDVAAHRRNFQIRASNDPTFASFTVLGAQGDTALPFRDTWSGNVPHPPPFRYLRVAKTDAASFSATLVRAYGIDAITPPDAPADFTAVALGSGHVRLAWNALSNNESGFKLERATAEDGAYVEIAAPPAAASSYLDSVLSPQTTYLYRICAVNEAGASATTAVVSATTAALSSYDQWSAGYPDFLALPEEQRLPAADPNGDGVPNLLAYATGLNPMEQRPPGLMASIHAPSPAELFFRYRRNKSAPDVSHQVWVSPDLTEENWQPLDQSAALVTPVPGEPDVEEVAVPVWPAYGETRIFARLRVVKP